MLRDEGRAFLEAGGRIEEADMVLRMLRVAVPRGALDEGHETEALALLHAVGGFQAYRRSARAAPTLSPVTRFLLFNSSYPGSVASSLDALAAASLEEILAQVQTELALVDRDIDTRYFAIAALAALHL